jgi:uncharacterized protein YndB with AHSA1/START domain
MPIEFAHTIEVPQPPEQVFATLDDVSQTPKWLARCTGIEVLTPGPRTVGTKLRYSYKDGGRSGQMDGEIVERTPGQKLSYRYEDKMMRVGVHFTMAPTGAGTRLTHSIDITPKTFFAKLVSPFIRKQLPKQTITAMESLRTLLATSGAVQHSP